MAHPPEKASLVIGERLELSVTVVGEPEPTLQWYVNGGMIEGATDSVFTLESVVLEDSGKYYVVASNDLGSVQSQHARVTVRERFIDRSVARQWNEETLAAIRTDYPAPTQHSRNLFHISVAMYDAWRAYEPEGTRPSAYVADESPEFLDAPSEQRAAISYAAYQVLNSRYRNSPGSERALASFRVRMEELGLDPDDRSLLGDGPAAVGNRIAAKVLAVGWHDGANESGGYTDQTGYGISNERLVFKLSGTEMDDPNRWQPLAFDFLVLQNGIVVGSSVQTFLGANWGGVRPFAISRDSDQAVYLDPGPPPLLSTEEVPSESDAAFKEAVVEVLRYSSLLDPESDELIDISPAGRHNNSLGANDGLGYELNPYTGEAYEPNVVPLADYGRVLAEFWADGPDSETPPGHWNSVANAVSDHPLFEKRFEGEGEVLSDLEWDVKLYFVLNAALSDAAIASWDAKRKYDYVRPISMVRHMGGLGQSTNAESASYHPQGLPLVDGLIELVTPESSAPGERHAHLSIYVGEIVIRTWQGIPDNPATEYAGVGWIRAVDWMPFQRDTFVTPPFAAYTSGHSTFSRAAAVVLTQLTGSAFFPGGLGEFSVQEDAFLEFEAGPSQDITLTWATYYDAADEAGLSRLYGGIHVTADDLNGRIMGQSVGEIAYAEASRYFSGAVQGGAGDLTYEEWATPIENLNPDSSDWHDLLETGWRTNLERFFYGAVPLERISNREARWKATAIEGSEFLSVELTHFYGIDATFAVEVSSDLRVWQRVEIENTIVERSFERDGLIRTVLKVPSRFLVQDGRYYLRIAYFGSLQNN